MGVCSQNSRELALAPPSAATPLVEPAGRATTKGVALSIKAGEVAAANRPTGAVQRAAPETCSDHTRLRQGSRGSGRRRGSRRLGSRRLGSRCIGARFHLTFFGLLAEYRIRRVTAVWTSTRSHCSALVDAKEAYAANRRVKSQFRTNMSTGLGRLVLSSDEAAGDGKDGDYDSGCKHG